MTASATVFAASENAVIAIKTKNANHATSDKRFMPRPFRWGVEPLGYWRRGPADRKCWTAPLPRRPWGKLPIEGQFRLLCGRWCDPRGRGSLRDAMMEALAERRALPPGRYRGEDRAAICRWRLRPSGRNGLTGGGDARRAAKSRRECIRRSWQWQSGCLQCESHGQKRLSRSDVANRPCALDIASYIFSQQQTIIDRYKRDAIMAP